MVLGKMDDILLLKTCMMKMMMGSYSLATGDMITITTPRKSVKTKSKLTKLSQKAAIKLMTLTHIVGWKSHQDKILNILKLHE